MSSKVDVPVTPPAERTIGQLVADTLRLYGAHFWRSLALGLGPATIMISLLKLDGSVVRFVFALTAGSLIAAICYIGAILIAFDVTAEVRTVLTALALAMLIFVPTWFLEIFFVLPAVAWFAFVGLAVPAALVEGCGFRASLSRGITLARADYVHVLGGLATLVLVALLTSTAMFLTVRAGSGQAAAIVAFLAFLVISPVLFLGSALLYHDQKARAAVKSASR